MAARNAEVRHLAARKAALTRWGREDPDTASALVHARADEYVARLVAQAPPLTDEQRDRLALLLRLPGGAAA